jgi:hypothetical protein
VVEKPAPDRRRNGLREVQNGHGSFDVNRPNFFIVGAPRCGTSSLWSYLKGHPDIFMPAEKELYFFDSDLWGNEGWAPTFQDYLGHFAQAAGRKKLGEATPSYLRSSLAAKEIKAFSPRAQTIVMLRNPLEVMYSLHSLALEGPEPIADFAAALKADAARTGRALIGYREFTDFPDQIQRYFDLFGRENVHTIIFDDLKRDSAAVCRGVLQFLGVNPGYAAEFPWLNNSKRPRSTQLQNLLSRPPESLRLLGRALLPQPFRSTIRRTLWRSNRIIGPRPPINPKLQSILKKELAHPIERLSTMLHRDLSAWCVESSSIIENGTGFYPARGGHTKA